MKKLIVKDVEVALYAKKESDYLSLTDIARFKSDEPAEVVKNWLRSKNTIEFLGLWEQLNNPNFKVVEFDHFKNQAGSNAFTLSPQKWIKATNAIGIISKSGRYGGTFAHKDIAFEFASWISPEFKLYLIKEFQRLKADEAQREALGWDVKREIAKMNYKIHTDAIKEHIVKDNYTKRQQQIIYASEADLLNLALWGMTAKEWRDKNPNKDGNIRDYASVAELVVLANLESMNAELIKQGIDKRQRYEILHKMATEQLKSFITNKNKLLKGKSDEQ